LGSKNRILLGILTDIILHHFRNTLLKKELYITKLKVKKIANKHPEIIHFITQHNFQIIIDNTIARCDYNQEGIYNLLAHVDEKYILYSVSINNFYLEGGTLFYTSKRQLRKCLKSIKFFNKKYEEDFLKFIES